MRYNLIRTIQKMNVYDFMFVFLIVLVILATMSGNVVFTS